MTNNTSTSLTAVLARVFWMLLGPLLLLLMTFTVVQTGNGWSTTADFAFLGILGAMMLARWLEFRSGEAQTADGDPATPQDLRRYLIGVAGLGLSVWVAANVVGNYMLTP
jgi:hypothetical protein